MLLIDHPFLPTCFKFRDHPIPRRTVKHWMCTTCLENLDAILPVIPPSSAEPPTVPLYPFLVVIFGLPSWWIILWDMRMMIDEISMDGSMCTTNWW